MCLGVVAVIAREDFQAMKMREQTQWIFDYLRTIQARVKYAFIIGTASVCLGAWRSVLGISESRVNQLIRKFQGEKKYLFIKHRAISQI